jgi:hypothetical protein
MAGYGIVCVEILADSTTAREFVNCPLSQVI